MTRENISMPLFNDAQKLKGLVIVSGVACFGSIAILMLVPVLLDWVQTGSFQAAIRSGFNAETFMGWLVIGFIFGMPVAMLVSFVLGFPIWGIYERLDPSASYRGAIWAGAAAGGVIVIFEFLGWVISTSQTGAWFAALTSFALTIALATLCGAVARWVAGPPRAS